MLLDDDGGYKLLYSFGTDIKNQQGFVTGLFISTIHKQYEYYISVSITLLTDNMCVYIFECPVC